MKPRKWRLMLIHLTFLVLFTSVCGRSVDTSETEDETNNDDTTPSALAAAIEHIDHLKEIEDEAPAAVIAVIDADNLNDTDKIDAADIVLIGEVEGSAQDTEIENASGETIIYGTVIDQQDFKTRLLRIMYALENDDLPNPRLLKMMYPDSMSPSDILSSFMDVYTHEMDALATGLNYLSKQQLVELVCILEYGQIFDEQFMDVLYGTKTVKELKKICMEEYENSLRKKIENNEKTIVLILKLQGREVSLEARQFFQNHAADDLLGEIIRALELQLDHFKAGTLPDSIDRYDIIAMIYLLRGLDMPSLAEMKRQFSVAITRKQLILELYGVFERLPRQFIRVKANKQVKTPVFKKPIAEIESEEIITPTTTSKPFYQTTRKTQKTTTKTQQLITTKKAILQTTTTSKPKITPTNSRRVTQQTTWPSLNGTPTKPTKPPRRWPFRPIVTSPPKTNKPKEIIEKKSIEPENSASKESIESLEEPTSSEKQQSSSVVISKEISEKISNESSIKEDQFENSTQIASEEQIEFDESKSESKEDLTIIPEKIEIDKSEVLPSKEHLDEALDVIVKPVFNNTTIPDKIESDEKKADSSAVETRKNIASEENPYGSMEIDVKPVIKINVNESHSNEEDSDKVDHKIIEMSDEIEHEKIEPNISVEEQIPLKASEEQPFVQTEPGETKVIITSEETPLGSTEEQVHNNDANESVSDEQVSSSIEEKKIEKTTMKSKEKLFETKEEISTEEEITESEEKPCVSEIIKEFSDEIEDEEMKNIIITNEDKSFASAQEIIDLASNSRANEVDTTVEKSVEIENEKKELLISSEEERLIMTSSENPFETNRESTESNENSQPIEDMKMNDSEENPLDLIEKELKFVNNTETFESNSVEETSNERKIVTNEETEEKSIELVKISETIEEDSSLSGSGVVEVEEKKTKASEEKPFETIDKLVVPVVKFKPVEQILDVIKPNVDEKGDSTVIESGEKSFETVEPLIDNKTGIEKTSDEIETNVSTQDDRIIMTSAEKPFETVHELISNETEQMKSAEEDKIIMKSEEKPFETVEDVAFSNETVEEILDEVEPNVIANYDNIIMKSEEKPIETVEELVPFSETFEESLDDTKSHENPETGKITMESKEKSFEEMSDEKETSFSTYENRKIMTSGEKPFETVEEQVPNYENIEKIPDESQLLKNAEQDIIIVKSEEKPFETIEEPFYETGEEILDDKRSHEKPEKDRMIMESKEEPFEILEELVRHSETIESDSNQGVSNEIKHDKIDRRTMTSEEQPFETKDKIVQYVSKSESVEEESDEIEQEKTQGNTNSNERKLVIESEEIPVETVNIDINSSHNSESHEADIIIEVPDEAKYIIIEPITGSEEDIAVVESDEKPIDVTVIESEPCNQDEISLFKLLELVALTSKPKCSPNVLHNVNCGGSNLFISKDSETNSQPVLIPNIVFAPKVYNQYNIYLNGHDGDIKNIERITSGEPVNDFCFFCASLNKLLAPSNNCQYTPNCPNNGGI